MSGSNKILTVSYGTFSCTLEGFEDPFNSMRSIAEYFRDLAADDRYFGAEPPTPDVEMLQALAERGSRGRVAARLSDTGVALTMRDPAAQPSGDTASDDDFADDEPEDALVLAEEHPRHDSPAETIAEKLSRIRAVVSRQQAPVSHEDFVEDGLAAEPPRSRALTRTLADIAADISGEDYLDEVATPDAPAEAEWSAVDEAPAETPDMAADEDEDAGGFAADAEDAFEAEEAEHPLTSLDEAFEDDEDEDDQRDDFMARAAKFADRDDDDSDADATADTPEHGFDPEPNAFFSPDAGSATEAPALDAAEDETEDEPFAFTDAGDEDDATEDFAAFASEDDTAPAVADLTTGDDAAPAADLTSDDATPADEDDDAYTLTAEDDDPFADLSDDADDRDDDTPPASAYRRESRLLDPVDDGEGVGRLMTKTEGKLADDDSIRRRRVISQMRAAVAATRADRILSSMSQRREDAAPADEPYRRDLDRVVSTPREKTPLMLVSALRVDEDQPRLPAAAPRDEDEGFARFAADMNARALTELLEAAAAYSAFVEGEPHFSRPDLMRRVADHAGDLHLSREQGLRSFGQLLREGKIRKLQRGQFTIDESTRYNPAHRIAGE